MDILELIKTRRSIRKYKTDPVSEEDLNKVLQAAQWAPSWANTQCARFIVVKDNEIKKKLANTLSPNNPGKDSLIEAPIVIVACAKTKTSGYYKGEPSTDKGEYWYMFDVGLSMANLTLMAHALGLGTVHLGAFSAKEVEKILELPDDMVVVEMTPLGYPLEKEVKIPPRKPLEELVYFDRYNSKN